MPFDVAAAKEEKIGTKAEKKRNSIIEKLLAAFAIDKKAKKKLKTRLEDTDEALAKSREELFILKDSIQKNATEALGESVAFLFQNQFIPYCKSR